MSSSWCGPATEKRATECPRTVAVGVGPGAPATALALTLAAALGLAGGCSAPASEAVTDAGLDQDGPIAPDALDAGLDLDAAVARALALAEEKLAATVTALGGDAGKFPLSTVGTIWITTGAGTWTSGFFPGCLWLMYEHTGRADFRTWAESWTATLESRKTATDTHDVGFQILGSFGQGSRIAGGAGYDDVIVTAAGALDTRYDPTVGCTRSWDSTENRDGTVPWYFPVIIDNMMNLELLFWASEHGGPVSLHEHALSHARRTAEAHVRADNSTYHVVDFNPSDGTVHWRGTHQGIADETTWARGQAWGVYGFTMAYRYTGEAALLDTAQNLADVFLARLPADRVPYWDFDALTYPGNTDYHRDTSAAAIVASALFELRTYVPADREAGYTEAARAILASLCSNDYLDVDGETSAILKHGDYHGEKPVIFGDYYFLEALMRYVHGLEWER